jgi:hypothetical protein
VLDADLIDITAGGVRVPDDSPGWKLDLPSAREGVLTEALTANGIVMFTTHAPGAVVDGSACETGEMNRVYAVSVDSGAAALDLNHDAQVTADDRSAVLEQQGVAPGVRIELPLPGVDAPGSPPPVTPGTPPGVTASQAPRCLVGVELLTRCVSLDAVLRTFWKRTSVN